MIERHVAAAQVQRFEGLDWFPREKGAALTELVKAMQSAPSEIVAEHITSELVHAARECPKPADLYRMIGQEREKLETVTNNCMTCNGTGMVIVERGGFTGAQDCKCRRAERKIA